MKRLIIALAAVTALSACDPPSPPQEHVFYCLDENELVEQHVGVVDWGLNSYALWTLEYSDGTTSYYRQYEGETCQVRPAVTSIE